MTKKNARKIAARARQRAHGGRYLAHHRIAGGSSPKPPDPPAGPPEPGTENDWAAKDHVVRAAFHWVQEPLVGIVEGHVGKRMGPNASGTIIRTPAGRGVILTCAHVVKDERIVYSATCIGIPHGIDDIAAGFIRHPDRDVDIALVLLKPEAERRLLPRAVDSSLIALPDAGDIGEDNWTVATGFPAEYRRDHRYERQKVIVQTLGAITYGCIVEGNDARGRFRISWREGVPHEPFRMWEEPLLAKQAPVQPLPHPGGISGGALWRFGRVPRDVIWSTESAGKLVGIPCSWHRDEGVQFAEPVKRWGDWFHRALEEIDGVAAKASPTETAKKTKPQAPRAERTPRDEDTAFENMTARERAYEEASIGRLPHDESEADDDGFIAGAGFDRYGGFPGDGLS